MNDNHIYLYGSVGASWWGEDYFTAATVREALADMRGPLTVHINSGGGIATEGQAIYTMLVDYADQVTVVVEGAAMSAASLIAMAGDEIVVRLGAFLLIHDPASLWVDGRGTEDDHLRLAKQLGITADAYAAIYAKRTGLSRAEARRIMRDETLLDGEMAVEKGFATSTDDSEPAATAATFDYRLYAHAPAAWREASAGLGDKAPARSAVLAMMAGIPRETKERKMTTEITANPAPAEKSAVPAAPVVAAQAPAPGQPVAPATDPAADARAAVAAERARVMRIRQAVSMAGLPVELADQMIEDGTDEAAALEKITAKWKENGDVDQPMKGREPARITADARDKFVMGATKAILAKTRLKDGERNEFSSMSLKELARESIVMAGEKADFRDPRELVGRAFTMAGGAHSTSDFANILANIQGKAALQGWEEAMETFEVWTRKGTLTDFKATKRVGAGVIASLPKKIEGADYVYVTVGDRGEPIALGTYGGIIRITREAILNDDLSVLGDLPRKMGRAAKATIGDLVYAVLTTNANMSDGNALFYAGGGNLATGAGSALQVSSLSTAKAAMLTQKDGTRVLNIRPAYLIVPAALELTAQQLINSSVDPRDAKGHAMNPVANMAQVVTDGRLDSASLTAWYLTADPNAFDTIEVAYLDGNDAPYLEEQTSWTSDGVEMKVRIDATAAPLERRTMYKAAGA